MERRKVIIARINFIFILIAVMGFIAIGKTFYIQQVEGEKWKSISSKAREGFREVVAKRGDIYNEDGELLSTTVPTFDIYIDFKAKGLRANDGELFKKHFDSLCLGLSKIFPDSGINKFKRSLKRGYEEEYGFYPLLKNINFRQYQALKQLPLVKLGKNKSGFIDSVKNTRLNPYKMYGLRTIGLARDAKPVGLELAYDSVLKGKNGKEWVRYVQGIPIPIENEDQTDAEHGKDIVSTLDVYIQQVADNALKEMVEQNSSEYGTAIVMETETGKIRAIANMGTDLRTDSFIYYERDNYALYPSEPGSTFKLATLITLIEDQKVNIQSTVNLRKGEWAITKDLVVRDSEKHDRTDVSVKDAFALSSNVGMASLVFNNYRSNPNGFINGLYKLRLNQKTNIDLCGENNSAIITPKDKQWNVLSTLPWSAFGYELKVTPLQTITLYNAIANNGKMMKPYLVSSIKYEGKIIEEKKPQVVAENICSNSTLKQVQQCLYAVCNENLGTGYSLFKNSPYKVAGKTGTNKISDNVYVYNDNVYQSSFVGYFPADKPKYTIAVVIRNTKKSKAFYGAAVAGPVFKKIADKIYARYLQSDTTKSNSIMFANSAFNDIMHYADWKVIYKNKNTTETNFTNNWLVYKNKRIEPQELDSVSERQIPSLIGLNCKDALFLCEKMGLKVVLKGAGRVVNQSLPAQSSYTSNTKITLTLK